MTSPTERTYAIVNAEKLLRDISISDKVPKSFREKAKKVLWHYPCENFLNTEVAETCISFGKTNDEQFGLRL